MTIQASSVRVTEWLRLPATVKEPEWIRITFSFRGSGDRTTLAATFHAPGECSDEEALHLARNWFYRLRTSLGTSTTEWCLESDEAMRLSSMGR